MMEPPKKTNNGQIPSDPAEKRSCPRYPFSPAVEAIDDQASIRIMGRVSDISRNSCYMDTINPPAEKSIVSLVITKDNLRQSNSNFARSGIEIKVVVGSKRS